jgi:site-specific recombinase XerD
MGYCNKKTDRFGQARYTAMFLDSDNKYRSAGTFNTKKEAVREWRNAEAQVRQGRGFHLVRGRMKFRTYVEEHWLPNLIIEVSTLENYTYVLNAHIIEHFADRRMIDIRPIDIKQWLTQLRDAGISPATRKYVKTLLSTIFSSAMRDEIVLGNPCLLVTTERVPKKVIDIITPEQFDQFYEALVGDMWKLLVETAIETGMRWGELTELRVKDFDEAESRLKVARAVIQVNRKFHPTGGRFLVKAPKDHEQRLLKIDERLALKIADHIRGNSLGFEDLLFWYVPFNREPEQATEQVDHGMTEPNEFGRSYRHGTTTAYTDGKCRCHLCKRSMADYRMIRRLAGKDAPRPARTWETDGHIPNRWFREQVIKPALQAADLKLDIKMHMLRHAHASWLLNGGADLVVVKERLGHASILTTEGYLHTVGNAGAAALAALNKVRNSTHPDAPTLVTFLEGGPVNEKELRGISSQVLFEYLSAFQTELNRRVIENETKSGA